MCRECATDVNASVAQCALQSIGKICVTVTTHANHCIDTLLSLLALEIDHMTSEIMVTMTSECGRSLFSGYSLSAS